MSNEFMFGLGFITSLIAVLTSVAVSYCVISLLIYKYQVYKEKHRKE